MLDIIAHIGPDGELGIGQSELALHDRLDLQCFKLMTQARLNVKLFAGRHTAESMHKMGFKPGISRKCYYVSRAPHSKIGCFTPCEMLDLISVANNSYSHAYCIGGAMLYSYAAPYCKQALIARLDNGDYSKADVFWRPEEHGLVAYDTIFKYGAYTITRYLPKTQPYGLFTA